MLRTRFRQGHKQKLGSRCLLIYICFLVLFAHVCNTGYAQDTTIVRKTYTGKIRGENKFKMEGIVHAVLDSALVLSSVKHKVTLYDTISFHRIRKIKLIRKGSGTTGFLIGAVASIMTGFIVASQVPPGSEGTPVLAALSTGIFLAIPVGIIGKHIGRGTAGTYYINYRHSEFLRLKSKLLK